MSSRPAVVALFACLIALLSVACLLPVRAWALVESVQDDQDTVVEMSATAGDARRRAEATQLLDQLPPADDELRAFGDAGASDIPATTQDEPSTTTTTALPTATAPPTGPSAPVPPTTTPPPPAAREGRDRATSAVVELVNAERREAGCAAVAVDDRLTAAAQEHSTDMATHGYFSHEALDGTSPFDRMRAAGHPRPGGENIAKGQRTAAEVMVSWMESPGHRSNILNCDFRTIGIGFDERSFVWAQTFGF